MKISIIIPTLNEAQRIGRLLEQLQAMREQGHEVILVDGGSRDDTRQQAKGRVDQLLQSEAGRSKQMNAGARASTGELLWFLHADSALSAEVLQAFERHCSTERDCWGFFHSRFDDPAWRFRGLARMMNWRSGMTAVATGDQGIFVRRDVFFAVGGYPDLSLMEDIALTAALKRKARPLMMPEYLTTSARRWQRHGFIRTVLNMWWLRLAFFLRLPMQHIARRYPPCNSSRIDS